MLDIDLGPRLVTVALVFIAVPVVLVAVASAAIVRLVRDSTRRLAVGVYVMLVCALVAPAPVLWGDDHLGFASSQAIEGYSALFWMLGAFITVDVLRRFVKLGAAAVLPLGVVVVAITCWWALTRVSAGVGLALVLAVGTLGALLAVGALTHRLAPAVNWRLAIVTGAACACAIAVYVYLRGATAFGAEASWIDLITLGVLACVPVLVLARSWHMPCDLS
jgi:hypothetical protein